MPRSAASSLLTAGEVLHIAVGGAGNDGGLGGGGGSLVVGPGNSPLVITGGGGGGSGIHDTTGPGDGGGSFDPGTDRILVADFRTGNGEVVIAEAFFWHELL